MKFLFKTRNQVPPANRQRVLTFFDQEEMQAAEDALFEPLLQSFDCAIWYCMPEETGESQEENPLEMYISSSVVVLILVTNRLLESSSELLTKIIKCAEECKIPILPVLGEPIPDQSYRQFFGNIQYLTVFQTDSTELEYREKLDARMREFLIGEEERKEILDGFRKIAFLSYRKKDRKIARWLMAQVHEIPQNIAVAIWFDDYLTPGEYFNEEIENWILRCDVFLLAVTRNLLEPDNYVLREEYPLALRAGKTIIPVLLEDIDMESFRKYYPEIADSLVEPTPELIRSVFGDTSDIRSQIFSQHDLYYLGCAYLNGIYVDKDLKLGVSSIYHAASVNYMPAIQKMSMLYRTGYGVSRNLESAYQWQELQMDLLLKDYRNRKDPQDDRIAEALFQYMLEQFNQSIDDGMPRIQRKIAKKMRDLCDEVARTMDGGSLDASERLVLARWLKNASVAECSTGDMLLRTEPSYESIKNSIYHGEKSCVYLERALAILEQLVSGAELSELENEIALKLMEDVGKALVINRQHLVDELWKEEDEQEIPGDVMNASENITRITKLVEQNTDLLEQLDGSCVKYRKQWFMQKAQMGKILLHFGMTEQGVFQYSDALAIGEDMFENGDGTIRLEQGIVCDRLADYFMKQHQLTEMKNFVDLGYRYRQEILKYNPDSYDAIRAISLSEERYGHYYLHLGVTLAKQENWDSATEQFEKSLDWYERCREKRLRIANDFPSGNANAELDYIEACIENIQRYLA